MDRWKGCWLLRCEFNQTVERSCGSTDDQTTDSLAGLVVNWMWLNTEIERGQSELFHFEFRDVIHENDTNSTGRQTGRQADIGPRIYYKNKKKQTKCCNDMNTTCFNTTLYIFPLLVFEVVLFKLRFGCCICCCWMLFLQWFLHLLKKLLRVPSEQHVFTCPNKL